MHLKKIKKLKLFSIGQTQVYLDFICIILVIFVSIGLSYYFSIKLNTNPFLFKPIILGTIAAILFFVSTSIHELMHVIIGKRYGLFKKHISLFTVGMESHFPSDPQTPKQELKIASAGPLISIVIAFMLFHLKLLIETQISLTFEFSLVFEYAFLVNLAIGIFNLSPVLPFDGGRILRALLWTITKSRSIATRITLCVSGFFIIFILSISIFLGEYSLAAAFFGLVYLYHFSRGLKKLYNNEQI